MTAHAPLKIRGTVAVENLGDDDPMMVPVINPHVVRLELDHRQHAVRCPHEDCGDPMTLFDGLRHRSEVHPGVDKGVELEKVPFPVESMLAFAQIEVQAYDGGEQVAVGFGFDGGSGPERKFWMILTREQGIFGEEFHLRLPNPADPDSPLMPTGTPGLYVIPSHL